MQQRRIVILLLVMIFMLPLFGAYWLHRHPAVLGLERTTNYGHWVKAKIFLPPSVHTARPWKLIFWHPNTCDERCFEHLNQLAKLRLAMGRKLYQLDIGLYLDKQHRLSLQEVTNMQQNDIDWAYAGSTEQATWNVHFGQYPIVLFSPEGQALLMYPEDFNAKKMYNDLQRLIRE